MKALFDYINRYSKMGISEEDFEDVKGLFTYKRLRKKQYTAQIRLQIDAHTLFAVYHKWIKIG